MKKEFIVPEVMVEMKKEFVVPEISFVELVPEEVLARGCWRCTANGASFC